MSEKEDGMLIQDLRFALRVLRKNPGFALVAFVTLAMGIGATTAIFSVVYEVLLRPLPYENPDQIVRLWEVNAQGQRVNFTDPNFEDIRSQSHSLQRLAEYRAWPESVSGGSEPTRTMVATVSRDFFPLMRVRPALGRTFAADEQRFGAAPTAMVSYGYWQHYLGSTADLSVVKLTIANQAVSVIGVLPPGFRFPDDSAIWMPRELRQRQVGLGRGRQQRPRGADDRPEESHPKYSALHRTLLSDAESLIPKCSSRPSATIMQDR